jgi:hypothetical protein
MPSLHLMRQQHFEKVIIPSVNFLGILTPSHHKFLPISLLNSFFLAHEAPAEHL